MDEVSIFLEALKKPVPVERAAFLDQACGGNEELRHSVELLLRAHDKAGGFLAPPSPPPDATVDQSAAESPGTVVGAYKLIEQIGEGGMGTVWMAQQTEPVKRLVALKLIKAGMDSKQVFARFEAERQALALMDHPNIARVLGAGTTNAGRPYFVMDLVKGVPMTKYCDEYHLTPRQRLELFIPVCQAVQHAHQKGIIHRDLKPSNVIVALYDGKPVPKVIDFGVAKAVGQSLTDETLVTGFGAIVGTLEYMSPEQAEINQLDIDTRSDIYSLGVLLYELLTGSPPFSRKDLEKAGMLEMLRVIREQEPSKPSTKLSTAEGLPTLAANRGTEPAKLTKLVRGELDWIVMKALEKDRSRRYETANGLAMDLERYLADESVQAYPPSAAYRLRKFARRNRAALATVGLVVLALFGGTGVSVWQAFRATRAERLAQTRLEAETEARSDAEAARSEEAAQRAVADRRRIEADEQRTEADRQRQQAEDARKDAVANLQKARDAVDQMLTRVGEERLANVPQMEPVRKALLEDALKFYQGFLQQKSGDPSVRLGTGQAWRRVANIYASLGQNDQSQKAYHESVAIFEKLVAEFPSEPSYRTALAGSYADLGFLLNWNIGEHETAEGVFGQAMALEEALATEFPDRPEHRFTVINLAVGLGTTLLNMGRLDEAEKSLRRAVAVSKELAAEDPRYRREQASCDLRLGQLLAARGKPSEAEQAFRQALAIQERIVAENPTERWNGHLVSELNFHLAAVLRDNGRPKEAEECFRLALAITQKLVADFPNFRWQNAHLTSVQLNLGQLLVQEHRLPEAEQVYRQATATMEALAAEGLPNPHWRSLLSNSQTMLAHFFEDAGRIEEAEQVRRQAVATFEKLVAEFPDVPDHRRYLAGKHQELGDLLRDAGKQLEAVQAYRKSLGLYENLVAEFPNQVDYQSQWTQCRLQLIHVLKATGQMGELENVHRHTIALYERLGNNRTTTHEEHLKQLDAEYGSLLNVLEDADQRDETVKAYQSSVMKVIEHALAQLEKRMEAEPANSTHWVARGRFLTRLGQRDKAAADFEKATVLQVDHPQQWFQCGWWVVGPYWDNLRAVFPPETSPDPSRPVAAPVDSAKEAPTDLHWRPAYTETDGRLDLGALFNNAEYISGYALSHVYSMSDQDTAMLIGSDDQVRVWLNGALVHEFPLSRGAAPNQDCVPVRLQVGWNTVLAKVINGQLGHALYLRISDDPADLARGYAERGQWDKAEPILATAVELRPDDPQLRIARGAALAHRGHEQDAAAEFAKAVEFKPDDPQVWIARGRAYAQLDRWQDADADFSKAIELSPYDEKLRREVVVWCRGFAVRERNLGHAASAETAYTQAISRIEKLAADFPEVADYRQELAGCHYGLGFCLAQVKDRANDAEAAYRQAIDLYDQLTAAAPNNQVSQGMLAASHNNLGTILQGHGKSEAAEKEYRQAIAIKERQMAEDPAKPEYRRELARCLDNLGRLLAANKRSDDAEQAYRRAVELLEKLTADFPYGSEFRDSLVQYSYDLAVLLGATGQTQEAKHTYGKLLQLAPKSAVAHNNLAWLLATCPDQKFRDAVRAVELAKKALELAPKEGNYWNTLGMAHCRAGEWKAAIDALAKSMELLSGKEESFNTFLLAMCHWQLGNKEQARNYYDQAVRWMDKNQPQNGELLRFRQEAEDVMKQELGVRNHSQEKEPMQQ